MKNILALFLVSCFLIISCGAPPEETKTEAEAKGEAEKTQEDIAYEKLSEGEIQKFIKAFPIFKTEVEKQEEELEEIESDEDLGSWIQQFSQANNSIAGLDAKLAAAGMPWNDFWPAFAKTITAVAAVMFDSAMVEVKEEMEGQKGEIAELEAKLKDPNVSAQEKEMIKTSLEMMKSVQKTLEESAKTYENVPQINKDLVKKHWKQLVVIFEIEE